MTDKPVHTKKPLTRPSVVQIEDAIRKSAGNVTYAAKALGVGRTALHARIAKSPDLQRVLQEEREALVDMAESALRAEVLDRNMTAIIWTLKASPEAKRRGWGERREMTGAEGGPIQTQQAMDEVSDDELQRRIGTLARGALAVLGGGPVAGNSPGAAADDSAGEE